MAGDYGKAVGARLRTIRRQQQLSLQAVEERSGGRWKAVVIGSYERGDRAVRVDRLAELADFYGVPVSELLPEPAPARDSGPQAIRVDLERLAQVPAEAAGPLSRFCTSLQRLRGDYNGRVLSIRATDVVTLALIYERTPEALLEQLRTWGVVYPDASP